MVFRKKASLFFVVLSSLIISQVGLTGCGGTANPPAKPTIDLSSAAQQTVSAIFTQTAAANSTDLPQVPSVAKTETPPTQPAAAAPTQPPAAQNPPLAIETLGAVPQEPTRAVNMEQQNNQVTLEPYHDPTVESAKSK